jgi:hypothetical protein
VLTRFFTNCHQPYNTEVPLRSIFTLLFFLCSEHYVTAQEVKFVDLSDVQQLTTLRVPQTKEPNCTPEPCVVTKETSVGDCTTDVKPLRIALDWVAPHDITLDPFKAEFRILNKGNDPVEVPISPQLSELQPRGNLQPFGYISLTLRINLFGVGPIQAAGVGWIELFGSAEHPDTILRLEPGQWMRVKTGVRLHTWPSQPVDAVLRGDFRVRRNVFKPDEHGGFIDSLDLCPNRATLPNAVEVHFLPIHLGVPSPLAEP